MIENQIIQHFASYCGEEKYTKFLQVLRSSARNQGRLMYWQEEVLRDFTAETGQHIPSDYDELVRMYSSRDRVVSLDISHDTPSHLRFSQRAVRQFHSVNQAASGGSHVTIFTVRFSSEYLPPTAVVRDECSPDDNPSALEAVLDELQRGVESFVREKSSQNIPVHSLRIGLLDFTFHEVDFKPHKYARAIQFVLEDLLCEQQCNRFVPTKMLGIPL